MAQAGAGSEAIDHLESSHKSYVNERNDPNLQVGWSGGGTLKPGWYTLADRPWYVLNAAPMLAECCWLGGGQSAYNRAPPLTVKNFRGRSPASK